MLMSEKESQSVKTCFFIDVVTDNAENKKDLAFHLGKSLSYVHFIIFISDIVNCLLHYQYTIAQNLLNGLN